MMYRTHLALGLAIGLYFLPHIKNPYLFLPVIILSSFLPDIWIILTTLGTPKQVKHATILSRSGGIFKTYTLCIPITILLAAFYPVIALPFFLGYSFNLILDSFSTKGIVPFWPFKRKLSGKIMPRGRIDYAIFYLFILFDIALLIKFFIEIY